MVLSLIGLSASSQEPPMRTVPLSLPPTPTLSSGASVAVSVTESDVTGTDSTRQDIRTAMLLQSELRGRIEEPGYYFHNVTPKVKGDMDLLMLTQGWRRYAMPTVMQGDTAQRAHEFEREQSISGKVSGTFHKVKRPKLLLLMPWTGYQTTIELGERDSFRLTGLDFTEGNPILLQATNRKGSDAFVELKVADKVYPKLSSLSQKAHSTLQEVFKENIDSILRGFSYGRFSTNVELPNITVKGRKIIPMNPSKSIPDRFYAEGDKRLETTPTIEQLMTRWGLRVDTIVVFDVFFGEETEIRCIGRRTGHGFKKTTIILDDTMLGDDELENVLLLSPRDIKQIEYFMNISGGVMRIYTKNPTDFSYYRLNKPLSMATVKQLGYKRPVEFYTPHNATLFDMPTLYWKPNLTIGHNGKTEITMPPLKKDKRYTFTIEGLTNDGETIHHQFNQTGEADKKKR